MPSITLVITGIGITVEELSGRCVGTTGFKELSGRCVVTTGFVGFCLHVYMPALAIAIAIGYHFHMHAGYEEGEAPTDPQDSGSDAEFLSSSNDSDMPPLEDATGANSTEPVNSLHSQFIRTEALQHLENHTRTRVRSFTRTQFISFCNARQEEMDLPPMGIHDNCEASNAACLWCARRLFH